MMMSKPDRNGLTEGELFYGYPSTNPTHRWTNGAWEQLLPEVHSDGPLPAGMGAIPADMPNSAQADVTLEYTLQNFNSLVAANAAMQTEISGFPEKIAVFERLVEAGEVRNGSLQSEVERMIETVKSYRESAASWKDRSEKAEADLAFAIEQRDANQRRLDRSLGYVDRMLDDEEAHRSPETRTVSAPKPPVGPDLRSIPEPFRKAENGASDHPFAFSRTIAPIHGEIHTDRTRRY